MAGVVPDDVRSYRAFAGLAVSADGRNAAYVLETPNEAGDGYAHQIFLLALDGKSKARSISGDDAFDDAPAFSADGRYLAFLSDDGSGAQVKVLRLGTKEPRVVTQLPWGVGSFSWSPDASRLAVVSWKEGAGENVRRGRRPHGHRRPGGHRDAAANPDTADEEASDDTADTQPVVIDRTLPRRDGEGWLGDERSHLWVVAREGGQAVQITDGAFDDEDPSWSPDGAWIAFSSNRAPDPDLTDDTDIYVVRPNGRDLRRLGGAAGPDATPSWSHGSDRVAWLSVARANDYYLTTRLVVQSLSGGPTLDLTGSLDTWVAEDWVQASADRARPMWSADDRELAVPLERHGTTYLASVPSAGGAVRELHAGRFTLDFVRSAGPAGDASRRFLFAQGDPTHPSELYSLPAAGGQPTRLTSLHDDWLAHHRLSTPQRVQAVSRDGAAVEAWLYPPLDRAAGKRYPLIVYVHGGPQAFDGEYFDEGLENQLFPAAGFGVLRVNYRGSTSYGEGFCAAIRSDWHRREFEDIEAAVDQAVALPWVDPARLGIGGWSYGGIMTLWAVSHSERYRAASPERFSADYLSSFGQDQWVAQYLAELRDPFTHEDVYRRLSPMTYAAAIRAPLLMIAGENDFNCPLPQALQLYQRLKVRGRQVQLVVYPQESHTFARPDHLQDRLQRLLDFYSEHLR